MQLIPYLLKTPTDLAALAQSVAGGETYQGQFFKLANDIDMLGLTQQAWSPIGDNGAPFSGTVDGAGYTIKNFNVNRRAFDYSTLFGYLESPAVLRNIKMSDAMVKGAGKYNAALAGYSKGLIENCQISGTVNSTGQIAGGIVGASEGVIKNSSFAGTVSGWGSVGGLAGNLYGGMSNCHAVATVKLAGIINNLDEDCGGLAGEAYSMALDKEGNRTDCYIADSYFAGVITDENGLGYTGGLVGFAVNMRLERSFNTGMISATTGSEDRGSGGLVGLASTVTATDCYNAGTILRSGNTKGAGGLAGYLSVSYTVTPSFEINDMSKFENCYNSGMVFTQSESGNRGLYGYTFEAYGQNPASDMFKNCWFDTQTNGLKDEKWGKPTSFFTSGTLPEGFDSKVWKAEASYYPVLAGNADIIAVAVSKSSVDFGNGESIKKVKSQFTLNSPENVVWKLYSSDGYVNETAALKISGNTVTIKDVYSNEMLVAMNSDGSVIKALRLAVVPKVFDGDGTESSPYLIKSKADFIKLHEAVQTYAQPHEGDFFKMANDVDFAQADDFQGVGGKNGKNPFGGTFDGAGHYIRNLKIHSATYDENGKANFTLGSYYYAGLFNVCGPTSTIKNVNIAADCSFDFWAQSAPVVGYTNGRVENCRNYAAVKGVYTQLAGIAGVADSTAVITGCYNAGNILVGDYIAGGIVGLNIGTVELCQNDGNVDATFYNALYREGVQSIAGGIVGNSVGKIDRSVNNGTVTTYKYVGGIVGVLGTSQQTADVTGCLNNGFVKSLEVTEERGGLIGNVVNKGTIANNYYDASINVNGAADNAALDGALGVPTSKLVVGEAFDGFKGKEWTFAKDAYPGLAAFATEEASVALRGTYVTFADGESRSNVITVAELSSNPALKWSHGASSNYTLEGSSLTVVTPTDLSVAKDTLTAVYGENYTKVYELTAIPQNLFDGKGTASDPYQIKTYEDMNKLSDFMASSTMEYEGYYFKLMNDIDYAGTQLKPIASGNVNFQGDFDGDGKTVSNFTFTKDKYAYADQNIALFGSVGAAGVVHDITVNGSVNGYRYVAGVAGKLYGTIKNAVNKGTVCVPTGNYAGGIASYAYEGALVSNCRNEGNVSAKSGYVGGILSRMEKATIENCSNTGVVKLTDGGSGSYVAGIVSYISGGSVLNCENTVAISSPRSSVSGIVANAGGDFTIENCQNSGDITAGGSSVGGIIGASGTVKERATLKNSFNTGAITGTGYAGGVAGEIPEGTTVEDCYNTGKVVATKSTYTGGVIGQISGDEDKWTYVRNSWNSGDVTGYGKTGGFAGAVYDEAITVEDCYNLGNVATAQTTSEILGVGGFTGDLSGHAIRCWNAGNVISSGAGIGGVGGYSSGIAENCFNLGDVTSTNADADETRGLAGGIWGFGRSTVRNCYNMGTITAAKNVAGINGQYWGEGGVENCYNVGKVIATGSDQTTVANIGNFKYSDGAIANNFFDKDVCGAGFVADQEFATGLSSKELFGKTELGEAYLFNRAAYPVIKGIEERRYANFAAASIEFAEAGDTPEKVTGLFYVGVFDNVAWTCSDNLSIASDGTVEASAKGAAWVKATVDLEDGTTLEKTINLNIEVATSGVDNARAAKEAVETYYYDFSGKEVAEPTQGTLYLVKRVYADGSDDIVKEFYREK